MSGFEIVETTADVGLKFYGKNEVELISSFLSGFYYLVFDENVVYDANKKLNEDVVICANSLEDMIFKLAEELIFQLYAKKKVLRLIKFYDNEAVFNLYGLANFIEMEIKAATLHKFEIKTEKDSFEGFIVFDI